MKRESWMVAALAIIALIAVVVVVSSCRGTAAPEGDPTPFPTPGASLTVTIPNSAVVEVTISELSSNPGLYDGAMLRVIGQYQRQPLLVCDADPHPSPATWGLAEEGLTALASGMDRELRALLPESHTMTIEGRWRRWQGLVGCGKSARSQDFYYLEVSRVISPSPLTMVTLTPDPNQPATEIAAAPPVITPTLPLTPTLEVTEALTATIALTPTETTEFPEFPTAEITTPNPDFLPTATISSAITPTALATPTSPLGATAASGTPSGTTTTPGTTGTPTVTMTGTPPTATPTATGQAQATPTLDPDDAEYQGELYSELSYNVGVAHLDANEIHNWDITIFDEESYRIQVISPAPGNIMVSVVRDGQIIDNRRNQAGAGAAEVVTISGSSDDGELFEILVETADHSASEYSIVIYDEDPEFEPQRVINGFLTSGSPRNGVVLPANTEHIWYFVGSSGTDLSFTISPAGASDNPLPILIGPNLGEDVDDGEIVDGDNGADDTLTDFELPETGLYALIVTDNNSDDDGISIGFTYDIVITLE